MNWVNEIEEAYRRISPYVLKTPLLHSPYLSQENNGKVFLKLESEQYTGSFKARGALNKILKLAGNPENHFITASTGNHAQGFARALRIARETGMICLPENAVESKVKALEYYGIPLEFYGKSPLESELYAKAKAEKEYMIWVSPYNDPDVIAGQGTIALEILEQEPDIDVVIGCVGGGGMMSGVATWFKGKKPEAKIIGALPQNSPEMYLSIQQNKVVFMEESLPTLSDGSAGGLEEDSITYSLCKKYVDDYTLVSESDIIKGIRWMLDMHHKIMEGAAAVALQAFRNRSGEYEGKKVAIIICGANISTSTLKELLN